MALLTVPSLESMGPQLFRCAPISARQALRPRKEFLQLAMPLRNFCLLFCKQDQLLHWFISRLYHFTLSHFGSQTPCYTLNPDVTASDPIAWYRLVANLCPVGLSPTVAQQLTNDAFASSELLWTHSILHFISVRTYYSPIRQPAKSLDIAS